MKEAYAMTELRAARNRMAFGEQEDEVEYDDESEGLGMAVKQVGKIRASIADTRNKGIVDGITSLFHNWKC